MFRLVAHALSILSRTDVVKGLAALQVTTLLSRLDAGTDSASAKLNAAADDLARAVSEQGSKVSSAKTKAQESGSEEDSAAVKAEVKALLQLKEQLQAAQQAAEQCRIPVTDSGAVDYTQDFFGRRAYLTVSGQLNGVSTLAPAHIRRIFGCVSLCLLDLGTHQTC
jgi:asparaginyl-tRNA synthetase